jgi:drug/metabolite transporter (DMT)-like permease
VTDTVSSADGRDVSVTRQRDLVGFLVLAALWGSSYPAIKAGLSGFPPILFAALRFDLIGLLVFGYAVTTGEWRLGRGDVAGVVLGGVFLVAVHNALLFVGQGYVTSAMSAVVLSTIPILAAGFSRPLLPSERLTAVELAGLLVGLVGVGVVATPSPSSLDAATGVGVVILLCSAGSFALGGVVLRRVRTDLPVVAMQAWMMLVGGGLLHVASLAAGETQAVQWSTDVVLAFVYLVPFAGAVGYLLYFALLDRVGPVEINLVGYVAPVFAAVVGWAALGEQLAASTVGGFAVIVVGFVLVKRDAIRAELA